MRQKCREQKSIDTAVRYLLFMTALVILLPASGASANALTENIRNVSEVCMDVQRVLKDYALIGMEVSYHDTLQEDLAEIDEHIDNIKSSDTADKQITAEILEIEKIWAAAEPKFRHQPFSKEIMYELHEVIDGDLTERCEKIIDRMAADSEIKGYEDVVQVARLGMASQRLAAIYLLRTWGIAVPDYENVVQHTLDKTDRIYRKLMNADNTIVSKEIKEEFKRSGKKIIVFGVMVKSTSGRFMPTEAAKMADELYEMLKHISKTKKTSAGHNVSYFIPVANEPNS